MSEPPLSTSPSSRSSSSSGASTEASSAGSSSGNPPASEIPTEYVRWETLASSSRHTVQAALSIAEQMPMTGLGNAPSAALEHAPALVIGDHLVEQPLLGAAVVDVVLVDRVTERLLGELAFLPEVDR